MRRRSSLRAGVTLLELMVVVTIMGVVGTMSAGRVHQLMVLTRIQRAASAVQNDLEAAFTTAGRNRTPVRISWNSANSQLEITNRAGTQTYRHTGLGRDPYGFTSGTVSVSGTVEVYPSGLATDTLLITMSLENITKKVRMSRAGMVQIQ